MLDLFFEWSIVFIFGGYIAYLEISKRRRRKLPNTGVSRSSLSEDGETAVAEIAALVAAYRKALVNQSVPAHEALTLVRAFQDSIINRSRLQAAADRAQAEYAKRKNMVA